MAIYAVRTTYYLCEKPDGTLHYKKEKIQVEASVQTIISTIYKVQVSRDVTDVRYVSDLPKDMRVYHPGVLQYLSPKDAEKLSSDKFSVDRLVHSDDSYYGSTIAYDSCKMLIKHQHVFFTDIPPFF